MSCESRWPAGSFVELYLPSNVVNLFNFIIFDILLISLVFHLTTEISARLNYLSLSDGNRHRLEIECPPIVGGGLCSTSRKRMRFLFFVRVMSFVLIFASNLAIEGGTKQAIVTKVGTRLVPGSLDSFDSENFTRTVDLRMSCQEYKDGFLYFGELRGNNSCEYNVDLLTDPVSFSVNTQIIELKPRQCESTDEKARTRPVFVRNYTCENARLQCVIEEDKETEPDSCQGVVEQDGVTYMCTVFSEINFRNNTWTGPCRVIRNFAATNEDWLPATWLGRSSLLGAIGITTIVRNETRALKEFGPDTAVTQVHVAWFVLLGAKVFLVTFLAGVAFYLVRAGAKCVVHDERSLCSLLSATVYRYSTFGESDSIYLNVRTNADKKIFWASRRPHRRRLNQKQESLEEAVVKGIH